MYHNGAEVRQAIEVSGIGRDAVWITSKLNTNLRLARLGGYVNSSEGVPAALGAIVAELGSAPDLLLLHEPSESADERLAVWRGLLATRSAHPKLLAGVSNFAVAQIAALDTATG